MLQELSIHLQSFLAICGLVVRPNLFMFQKDQADDVQMDADDDVDEAANDLPRL